MLRLPPTFLLYGLMAVAGWAWLWAGGRRDPARLWVSRDVGRDLALGLGVGAGVLALTRGAAAFSRNAAEMEAEFGRAIGRPPRVAIPALAMASAVGEEMFFRGALQAHAGVWVQAALFGALHVPWSRKLAGWPVFAGLVGLLFGWTTAWTGNLWPSVLAHAAINQVNLWMIAERT
ncbi:MAG: CPBP family intramembrane metalloprotease [Planctomycetes bacterium]|nr:CPBP family intramembrane metalloprotease [Planctomycetota bacterium]